MRQQFVGCKSRKTAWKLCPWAATIVKVDGGFQAFESWSDLSQWLGQR